MTLIDKAAAEHATSHYSPLRGRQVMAECDFKAGAHFILESAEVVCLRAALSNVNFAEYAEIQPQKAGYAFQHCTRANIIKAEREAEIIATSQPSSESLPD